MDGLLHDLRTSIRSLRRGGAVAALAVLTLTLGIGANSALYSVVDSLLLRPLSVPEAPRVLALDRQVDDGTLLSIPIPTFEDWLARNRTFAHLGGYALTGANLTGDERPERLVAAQVTSGFFAALGSRPRHGRLFDAEADRPGAPRQAVLADGLWQRRYGGDPGVIDRVIELNGKPYTVIGVLPPAQVFPAADIDVWLPLGAFAEVLPWTNRSVSVLYAVGRLRDGVELAQARRDLEAVTATIAADTGVVDQPVPRLRSLREALYGSVRRPLLVLLAAVGFVLLITCANVANLLLVRAEGRRGEIATRMALGASRLRIARQLLIEGLTLAAAGCLLGIAGAPFLASLLRRLLPPELPQPALHAVDLRVLAVTAAVAAVSGVLVGLAPALRIRRADLHRELRLDGRDAIGRGGLRSALVVVELAVALVLLAGAGLMLRTLSGLGRIDLGFEPAGVLAQRLTLPAARYGDDARWVGFHRRLLDTAANLPGVTGAAVASSLPLGTETLVAGALPEGRRTVREEIELTNCQMVSPGYFETLGIQLLAGRPLRVHDDADAPLVAVVDETLAARFWPGQDPLGKRMAFEFHFPEGGYRPGIELEAVWREVVGVVAHVRQDQVRDPSPLEVYVPYAQPPHYFLDDKPEMALLLRTDGAPSALAGAARAAVATLDPALPVYGVQTLESVLRETLSRERLVTGLLAVFSLLAAGLAGLGIYGVIGHTVVERRREIGLRMALGARRGQVLGLVVRQGTWLALLGIVLGLIGAAILTRLLASLLYGVSALDLATFVAVPAAVLALALLACLPPALRASRIDPLAAIRYDQ